MSRLVRSPVALVVVLLAAAFAVPSFAHGPADWEKAFVPGARAFRDGEPIYQPRDAFVYPPFVFLLALPSTYLPPLADRAWWWAANTAAAAVLVCGSWVLAGGRFGFRQPPREWVALALGGLAGIGFVFHVAVARQIDLVVGALVVGGLWAVIRGRTTGGGLLIGVASAIKCTPLLFAPYFAWTGRWRAAVAVVVAAVGFNLLPDALFPRDGELRLAEWSRKYLTVVGHQDVYPGTWYTDISFNHSVAGWVTRTFTRDHVQTDGRWTHVPKADAPPARTLKWAVYTVGLALLIPGAAVSWVRSRTADGFVFEAGMILCLMLLMSPVSSTQHFCTLLLPAWAVARFGLIRRDGVAVAVAVAVALLGLTTNRDLVGKTVNSIAMWHGSLTGLTVLLYAGCGWCRLRSARAPEPAGVASP